VYYNHALQAVIIKPAPTSTPTGGAIAPPVSKPVLKRSRELLLRPPLSALRTFFDKPDTKIFGDPLVNSTRFDNLFILKGSDRNYFGFLEKDVSFGFETNNVVFNEFVDVAAIAYDGITVSDPATNKQACDLMNDRIDPSKLKAYSCAYDGSNLRMAGIEKTAASGATEFPLRRFWRDMTAKLR